MPTTKRTASANVAAAIAKTDWKACYENEVKKRGAVVDDLERANALAVELRNRVEELRRERDQWRSTVDGMRNERDAAHASAESQRQDATRQARRADFWKGVAMGLDAKKATKIEARTQIVRPGGPIGKPYGI